MKRNRGFNRRAFLRGAAGVALTLPALELFSGEAGAQTPPNRPKRFILFVHQQGTLPQMWTPSGAGASFTLPQLLAPLTPHQQKLLVVAGIDNKVAFLNQQTDGHVSPERTLLTAMPYSSSLDSAGNLLPKAQQQHDGEAAGPSIDQELASRISADTPYRSIDIGIGTYGDASVDWPTTEVRMQYAGRDDRVTTIWKPQAVFDRFFAGLNPMGDPEADRLRARNLSVLDAVKDSFTSFRQRLGKTDRDRLDAHAEKLRGIEKRIEGIQVGAACQVPQPPSFPAGYDPRFDDHLSGPVMIEMMTMALACGLSNVATLCFPDSHGPRFRWLNNPSPVIPSDYTEWHDMVHRGWDRGDDPSYMEPGLPAGFGTYTDHFLELLARLEATPEDGGTMLDHTAVLWVSDFGKASLHSPRKLPVVMAGNYGDSVQMGRFVDLRRGNDDDQSDSDYCTNQLYTSVLNAFGFDDQSFGFTGSHYYEDPALAWGGSGTMDIATGGLPI